MNSNRIKPKLGVVVGKIDSLGSLSIFESLTSTFDVRIFATQDDGMLATYPSSCALHMFGNIEDMPGYLRGLDEALDGTEMILGWESSRLSSFQAVRAALKYQKPVCVMVSETRPFQYDSFPNIRAIQADVMQHADSFVALSQRAADKLCIEGIQSERMTVISPAVGSAMLMNAKLREKMRTYIGIKPEETLVLFREALAASHRPMEALLMLRSLMLRSPELAKKCRLLFVGIGGMERDLKYRAHQLGLTRQVLFMAQDPNAFLPDLYNAADIMLSLRKVVDETFPVFPQCIIEAMACGVLPIVAQGSPEDELLAGAGISIADDGCQGLSIEIEALLREPATLLAGRENAATTARKMYSAGPNAAQLGLHLENVLRVFKKSAAHAVDSPQVVYSIEKELLSGSTSAALVMVEDYLIREPKCPKFRSELWRLKGDIQTRHSQLADATESYSQAVQADAMNHRGYFGLGQVSFLSHANEDSLVFYRKALAKCPNHSGALLGIGLIHQRMGLNAEALYWFGSCLSNDPQNQRALTALTQASLESTNFHGSINTLEQAREVVGEVPRLLRALGQLYLRVGRTEEAEAIFAADLNVIGNGAA